MFEKRFENSFVLSINALRGNKILFIVFELVTAVQIGDDGDKIMKADTNK